MSKYDRQTIIKKINRELPIIVVYNYLVMNKHLIHPSAIKNEHILNGEITLEPIELDDVDFEKDKFVESYCFFHNSLNMDSTNFVLPKVVEQPSTDGKKDDYGNYYNCFGCQHSKKPLGVIDFYMVMRFGVRPKLLTIFKEVQKQFWDSVEELSALMGISYNDGNREYSDEEKKKFRRQLILKRTTEIYHSHLKSGTPFAKRALAYLFKERGFSSLGNAFYKVIDELMIGCAPKEFDSTFIYDQLKKEGFSDEELLEAKVVKQSSKNPNKIIDFHKNGIILPYTKGGQVHNIYCRQFTKEKKWRHMRLGGAVEYPVNFDNAKKFPFVIVVEGEIDFVTFKALGFDNVISVGGTKGFKDDHINTLLYEYDRSEGERCRTVYLCLDGDDKGQEAISAVAERLLAEGFDVRAIRMQTRDKKTGDLIVGDPNEFLQRFGMEAKNILQQLIDEALSYQAFLFLQKSEAEKPTNPTEQLGFIRRNKRLLDKISMDEKLFIALEVAEHFNIKPEWLLQVWGIMPEEKSVDTPNQFPKEALDKHWIVLFDNKEMADVCHKRLPNVICYNNPHEFVEAAKNHGNLRAIVLHENLSNEYKDIVFHAFPKLQFQTFIGEDAVKVDNMKKFEFMALFRKVKNPYLNAAS